MSSFIIGVNKVRFCRRGLLFIQVLLIGHVQLWGTAKSRLLYLNMYSISCLPGGISKDVIWHPKLEENSSVFILRYTFFPGRGQPVGRTLCALPRCCSLHPGAAVHCNTLAWQGRLRHPAAVLGSSQGLLLKVLHPVSKSLLWVPDLHKRSDAKFSMLLVLLAAFLIKLI